VEVSTAHRSGPDPRVERTRQVVLDTTIEILAEQGYGAVTIEAVAARSGVAKSTIYRHWPGRLELVNDAFHALKPPIVAPTEGSLQERVVDLLENLARNVATSSWSACLPALIDAAEHDPEARELHRRVAATGRQTLVDLLSEGMAKGELPPDLDPVMMTEALAGPIMLRRLFSSEPFDPAQVGVLVDQVLRPAATAPCEP
jgi:TetR/AcrR family transcriptional regulator, regulator of autoinduction and epiphytic fitness